MLCLNGFYVVHRYASRVDTEIWQRPSDSYSVECDPPRYPPSAIRMPTLLQSTPPSAKSHVDYRWVSLINETIMDDYYLAGPREFHCFVIASSNRRGLCSISNAVFILFFRRSVPAAIISIPRVAILLLSSRNPAILLRMGLSRLLDCTKILIANLRIEYHPARSFFSFSTVSRYHPHSVQYALGL